MQKAHILREIRRTAEAAVGEWLGFVDADTLVNPGVVAEAVKAMRGGAVGGGSAFRFDGRLPPYGRVFVYSFFRAFVILLRAIRMRRLKRRGDFEGIKSWQAIQQMRLT